MKPISTNILGLLQKRLYGLAAAKSEHEVSKVVLPKHQPKITRLNNGTLVVSQENYSPISHISILFKAGPRFESYENLGVNHALRAGASMSTRNKTQFGLARNLQQMGADISCSTSREHITYSLQVPRKNLIKSFEFFGETATMQDFKSWEVNDQMNTYLTLDLARLSHQHDAIAIELFHKAAYRRALANSLYIDEQRIPLMTNKTMTQYACEYFTAAAMVVAGVGIDHDDLIKLTQSLNVSGTATKPKPALYFGGEERLDIPTTDLVHAILGTRSYGICEKETPSALVLQKLLGVGPHIKYSDNTNTGRIQRAAQKASCNPVQASALHILYSDSGLFGMQIVGKSKDIGPSLKAVTEEIGEITTGTISDELLESAKKSVKSMIMMELESDKVLVQDLALQAAYYGALVSTKDILQSIDQVDANNVRNVATQIIKGKGTLVAVGNLSMVPFLDELEL